MKTLHIPYWLYFLFAGVMIVALIWHWQHVLSYAPFIFILGHGGHGKERDKEHTH